MEAPLSYLAAVTLVYAGLLFAVVRLIVRRPVNSRFEIGEARGAARGRATVTVGGGRARSGGRSIWTTLSWVVSILLVIVLLAFVDSALVSWAGQTADNLHNWAFWEKTVPVALTPAMPDPVFHAAGLLLAIATAILATRFAGRFSALPALLGFLGCICIALIADLIVQRASVEITTAERILRLMGFVVVASSVLGVALAGNFRHGTIAVAAGLYLFGLAFRLASLQVVTGLWPLLFDATSVALLMLGGIFPISLLSVLCFIGPAGFACSSANTAKARRLVSPSGPGIGENRNKSFSVVS